MARCPLPVPGQVSARVLRARAGEHASQGTWEGRTPWTGYLQSPLRARLSHVITATTAAELAAAETGGGRTLRRTLREAGVSRSWALLGRQRKVGCWDPTVLKTPGPHGAPQPW